MIVVYAKYEEGRLYVRGVKTEEGVMSLSEYLKLNPPPERGVIYIEAQGKTHVFNFMPGRIEDVLQTAYRAVARIHGALPPERPAPGANAAVRNSVEKISV